MESLQQDLDNRQKSIEEEERREAEKSAPIPVITMDELL